MKTAQLAAFLACLGACTTPQPTPECNLPAGSFWARYTLVSDAGTDAGACTRISGEGVGFQRYLAPGSKEPTFAMRAQHMGEAVAGVAFPVPRVNPSDPDAGRANSLGDLTLFPDQDGLCEGSGISEALEDFQAETVTLSDGGTEVLPPLHLGYRWSNLKVTSTAAVPGTVFTADLSYSEGTCRASYQVTGIWPLVTCATNEDCNPVANVEAGRAVGSGLNPEFVPECNVDAGVCEATVPPEQLR